MSRCGRTARLVLHARLAVLLVAFALIAGCTGDGVTEVQLESAPESESEITSDEEEPGKRILTGTLELRGDYEGDPGSACKGRGDFKEFSSGKTIRVLDDAEQTLARGWLHGGKLVTFDALSAPACVLSWEIPGVDGHAAAYSLNFAGEHSEGPWSAEELDEQGWHLQLTLGRAVAAKPVTPKPTETPADETEVAGLEVVRPPAPAPKPAAAPKPAPNPPPAPAPAPAPAPVPKPAPAAAPALPAGPPQVVTIEPDSCIYDASKDSVSVEYTVVFDDAAGWVLPAEANEYKRDARREGALLTGFERVQGTQWTATFFAASAYQYDLLPLRDTLIVEPAAGGDPVEVPTPQRRLEFSSCDGLR